MLLSERFKADSSIKNKSSFRSGQLEEIHIVKGKLDNHSLSLEKTVCPCGSDLDYGMIATTERYGIGLDTVICDACGTLRFKKYLTTNSLSQFYINHYQKMYGRLSNLPEYFKRQDSYGKRIFQTYKDNLEKGDNVLEIGCGAGGALNHFKQQKLNVYGCEYSQTLVEYAHKKGLKSVYQGSLFDIQSTLPEALKFKLIYIHHVFEHVNNPLALLEKCRSLLADDGKLVIGVPDFLSIDKYANPGCNLLVFLHIAHKYNFTSACFHLLANQADLHYEKVSLHKNHTTPWAVQPELWGEFSTTRENQDVSSSPVNTIGEDVYHYLVQTENNYKNKKCSFKKTSSTKGKKSLFRRLFNL